jgi:undecaprenyl-diphosphatase
VNLFQAIILGIVQGLTEFLPISSTAHLRIVPSLLGWNDPGAAFSAVIQIGTLLAVLAYFRQDIVRIGRAWLAELVAGKPWRGTFGQSIDARLGWMMIWGTVPIVVCGLLFKKHIETTLRSLYVMAASLIALALVLCLAEVVVARRQRSGRMGRPMHEATWLDAIVVGLAQAMALVPGSSRSGVTITGALFVGLSREAAARYSFLLSLPAVLAAAVYELYKKRDELLASQADAVNLATATLVSGVVGYASIAFLLTYLRRHTTYVFIGYRLALGGLLFGLLSAGLLVALR